MEHNVYLVFDGNTLVAPLNENTAPETGPCLALLKKLVRLQEYAGTRVNLSVLYAADEARNAALDTLFSDEPLLAVKFERDLCDALGNPIDVFFSADPERVLTLHDEGIPAVLVSHFPAEHEDTPETLVFAFDADGVLTDGTSEQFYQQAKALGVEDPLGVYMKREAKLLNTPLNPGPLFRLALKLCQLRDALGGERQQSPALGLEVVLCTARNLKAFARMLFTLEEFGLSFDQVHGVGKAVKGHYLPVLNADVFFDDHPKHIGAAKDVVLSCRVPQHTFIERAIPQQVISFPTETFPNEFLNSN